MPRRAIATGQDASQERAVRIAIAFGESNRDRRNAPTKGETINQPAMKGSAVNTICGTAASPPGSPCVRVPSVAKIRKQSASPITSIITDWRYDQGLDDANCLLLPSFAALAVFSRDSFRSRARFRAVDFGIVAVSSMLAAFRAARARVLQQRRVRCARRAGASEPHRDRQTGQPR